MVAATNKQATMALCDIKKFSSCDLRSGKIVVRIWTIQPRPPMKRHILVPHLLMIAVDIRLPIPIQKYKTASMMNPMDPKPSSSSIYDSMLFAELNAI
jgi:hypothetical protein